MVINLQLKQLQRRNQAYSDQISHASDNDVDEMQSHLQTRVRKIFTQHVVNGESTRKTKKAKTDALMQMMARAMMV